MIEISAKRLTAADREVARALFVMMADVFETPSQKVSEAYAARLLQHSDFWAIAAFIGSEMVGGLTAHTLPMTRAECSEVFIYDIAVREDHQRKGVGRSLVTALLESAAAAGIDEVFVPADNEDQHALDFYRALGGVAAPVTIFTFSHREER